ncbi:MAG: polyphosphate kinase 1 [Lentimicrobiaceae bacterium]|nr:polyphosphate kinase 1 [Lentimicrobiaceae bacterium]
MKQNGNIKHKNCAISREITWMHFNDRVLQEAADPTTPLIERIKFLGIYSNNLDEFFRVRVATLTRMANMNKKEAEGLPFDPIEMLQEISYIDTEQQKKFAKIWHEILKELEKNSIFILNERTIHREHSAFVKNYFRESVRPFLFPIMLDNLTAATSLKDKSIYFAILLHSDRTNIKDRFALMEIPSPLVPRFLILPEMHGKKYIILLDDVIRYCLSEIFSPFGYDTFKAYTVKLTRDAELDIDTDVSKSFLETMQESLKQRKLGSPVRLIFDKYIPEVLLKTLLKKLGFTRNDTLIKGGRYHNFKDFMSFPNMGNKDLEYEKLLPLPHIHLAANKSIFSAIRQKDVMIHFPYQSFQYILDLLREASIDPKVRSIRMTIYRVATNSNVINALINAARNGKSVTVFLELQARFDEEANIYWTQKLREEGVKIIHSIPGYKVHCKLMLIRRRENNQDVLYANVGTGNFNEQTARIYTDHSLLTANQDIAGEVLKVFELFEANYKQQKFKTLIVSPFSMRRFFIRMLNEEIKNARNGKQAYTIIKLNNLVDEKTINKLYQASNEGVKIKLIIRGSCTLQPGITGLSENIEAISIVDRFLEHTRVLVFANGGDEKIFISSADWMIRNFDNRIEVATPILDPEIRQELRTMLDIYLNDNCKARYIKFEKPNQYRKNGSQQRHRSQIEIYDFLKNKIDRNQ